MGEMNGTIDVRLEHAQGIHVILIINNNYRTLRPEDRHTKERRQHPRA